MRKTTSLSLCWFLQSLRKTHKTTVELTYVKIINGTTYAMIKHFVYTRTSLSSSKEVTAHILNGCPFNYSHTSCHALVTNLTKTIAPGPWPWSDDSYNKAHTFLDFYKWLIRWLHLSSRESLYDKVFSTFIHFNSDMFHLISIW